METFSLPQSIDVEIGSIVYMRLGNFCPRHPELCFPFFAPLLLISKWAEHLYFLKRKYEIGLLDSREVYTAERQGMTPKNYPLEPIRRKDPKEDDCG